MHNKSNPTCQHIKALLRKNWILFKRSCCCSCCEMLLPILFAFLLLIIRSRIQKEDIAQTDYLDQAHLIAMPVFPLLDFPAVALTPKDSVLTSLIETNLQAQKLNVMKFDSNQAINDYVRDSDYGETVDKPKIAFGISIKNAQDQNYEYELRFNVSGKMPVVNPNSYGAVVKYYPQNYDEVLTYWSSGFLYIQNMIDGIIFTHETGQRIQGQLKITSVEVPAYTKDTLSDRLQDTAQVYVVFPWIVLFLRFLYRLLYEKERKITEGMKMMGMSHTAFYVSWFITYGIISFISVLLTTLLFKLFFKHSNFLILFLWEWLFVLSLLSQALFVSVFFTRPRSGIMAGLVFFFVQYYVNRMVAASEDVTMAIKTAASLTPHAAMSFASELFVKYEALGVGVDFSTISEEMNNYKVSICFGFVILNFVVYLFLAIYLDLVIPNEFGKKKHPLFFLDCLRSKESNPTVKERQITPKQQRKIELSEVDNSKIQILKEDIESGISKTFAEIVEPVDANLKQQEAQNKTLDIKNLSKVYANGKQAVSDLSLTMYQGQIFALLGHNGAGKTTTISILTGLIEATSGLASVFGIDLLNNMDEIRHFLGVCPQHDILFDQLTVKEHLVLFATFKGVPKENIPQEVTQMIKDIGLEDKTNFKAKNLSGGQKRKLSVGIAYIGNSKLILLDEPTSGMDTSARRFVWEMLKNNKNDKIVILTTHFMDEADFLGDRIGIMSSGGLKCCGSSLFLKNRFGIGYNLIIVKKSTRPSPELKSLVLSMIPKANLLSDVSAEISFQLPLEEMGKFGTLFSTLDEKKNSLGILSYGVSITTLEEVFLKVAEGDVSHRKMDVKVDAKEEVIDDFELKSIKVKNCVSLFWLRFCALVLKRLRYFRRDIKGIFAEIFLPIIVIIVGLCLMLITFYTDPSARLLTLDLYSGKSNIIFAGATSQTFLNYLPSQVFPTLLNIMDVEEWDNQIYLQRSSSDATSDLTLGGAFFSELNLDQSQMSAVIEGDTRYTDSFPILLNTLNQAMLRAKTNINYSIKVWNSPLPQTKREVDSKKNISAIFTVFIFAIGMSLIPASLVVYIVKEKQYNVKHQQLVSGAGLFSYWMSNLFVDWVKVLIPTVFSALLCKAFNISAFLDDDCYAVMWLLFIFFGFCIITFTYLTAFLFKDYGSAQTVSFILNFLLGGIVPLIFFILRLLDDKTKSIALGIAMILRVMPSFAFGFGILNVAERALYAAMEGDKTKPREAFDTEIAGYDVAYLIVLSFVYFVLVFLVEKLSVIPSCSRLFTRESNYPYNPRSYDSDVQSERDAVNKCEPSKYSILVKELRKVFAQNKSNFKVAVDSVSFAIPGGECFGLLGVNGAGKTTTFKMLCGEVTPSAGQVFIAGYDLYQNLDKIRDNIGYCPQFDALLDLLTSRDHLELFAALKGIPKSHSQKLIDKKLNEMNLRPFENVCAGTYSGGNKRKLSVALAMLGNPPIVFLDEPSTGMDPEARRFMWNVISRISSERKRSSIILTTHSMEEAEALSNRIAIMVNGSFQCLGTVQHIKNKFGKGYELEVKLVIPRDYDYNDFFRASGKHHECRIYRNDLENILRSVDQAHLAKEIRAGGYGAHINHDIDNPNGVAIEVVFEFVLCEMEGAMIMEFLKKNFGDTRIIEHFQTFFRFKLQAEVSIGKLFSAFEENKNKLKISQYSIRQATIEQIFNMFAAGQIEENQDEKNVNSLRKSSSLSIFNNPGQNGNPNGSKAKTKIYKKDVEMVLEDVALS